MAEEFQASICGGNIDSWWMNPTRVSSLLSPSPSCSSVIGFSDSLLPNFACSSHNNNNNNNPSSIATTIQTAISKLDQVATDSDLIPNMNWSHPALVLREEMSTQELDKNWRTPTTTQGFETSSTTTTLLQTLFDSDQQIYNNTVDNYNISAATGRPEQYNVSNDIQWSSPTTPPPNPIPIPSAWSSKNFINQLSKPSLLPKHVDMQFANNAPFWTTTSRVVPSSPNVGDCFFSQARFHAPVEENKIVSKLSSNEESVNKKGNNEPQFKRPRLIETPSPLPTFKVRKEKLGDRITALQQLVSPFGKTDTASVLHEAIEYIKFLHEQVNVLSDPYMKQGNQISLQQQNCEKLKEIETIKQDLKSRGLCLVPISSTYPVANENTTDLWTPTYGGTFR